MTLYNHFRSLSTLWICSLFALCTAVPAVGQNRLLIDKNRMTISLLNEADTMMLFPISCGRGYGQKQGEGDFRTPEGVFRITQIVDASQWGHDFGDGLGYIQHAYGPWFIRLSAGNGIGIHGTHDPASMGLRASEGCIRLRNEDLMRLKPYLFRRMEVEILPDSFPLIKAPKVEIIKGLERS